MTITIETYGESSNLGKAKQMIEESLLQFLNDKSSEGRLLYELASTLQCNFNIQKGENGLVRQESYTKYGIVWMKLLELPCGRSRKGNRTYHGKFLMNQQLTEEVKDGRKCSVKVYGIQEGHTSELCDPYVLISGNAKDEVNQVAANMEGKLIKHQKGCSCKFLKQEPNMVDSHPQEV